MLEILQGIELWLLEQSTDGFVNGGVVGFFCFQFFCMLFYYCLSFVLVRRALLTFDLEFENLNEQATSRASKFMAIHTRHMTKQNNSIASV